MSSEAVKVVATGLRCWTLAAAGRGQDVVDEYSDPPIEAGAQVTQALVPDADAEHLEVESFACCRWSKT